MKENEPEADQFTLRQFVTMLVIGLAFYSIPSIDYIFAGADPGEVKRVNFHPPFSEPPSFFFFLIPQILIGSNTLLQKFTPISKSWIRA